jgi:hypothetical protein
MRLGREAQGNHPNLPLCVRAESQAPAADRSCAKASTRDADVGCHARMCHGLIRHLE